MPPGFDEDQKIDEAEIREIVACKLPPEQQAVIKTNGRDRAGYTR